MSLWMAMDLKGLNKQSWSFKQNDSEENWQWSAPYQLENMKRKTPGALHKTGFGRDATCF